MNHVETAAESRPAPVNLEFSFTGRASEYFGIWIVNLFLSIITLGIYTAWAKVRRLRYFYGNSWLDGHNFEYHGDPNTILVGRVIVVAALLIHDTLVGLWPDLGFLSLAYVFCFPLLLNKSMSFNARMTSYRNVRLNFQGTYWGAFFAFLIMPLVALLSAGLLAPLASKFARNYIGRHLGYGSTRFETNAPLLALYGNLGVTVIFIGLVLLLCIGGGFLFGSGLLSAENLLQLGQDKLFDIYDVEAMSDILTAAAISAYIALALAYLFYEAGVRNIAYNHTVLDGRHRFTSRMGRRRYVWIQVSNLLATVLTLGLLRPWAVVRSWRYLVVSTGVIAVGLLDDFVDEAAPEGNVSAAEYFDIEGIDIAF
ncbi:YjgN family protein [Nitratireductor sp. GZWM139]|uniref:YjgN family protein n=1 Tax=Nitratireductor sp. GZWM139 TaxID=2950541 RepID=UPI0024BDB6A9|nr:YjgN family protein [Nitratireductor sp. GZWM139]MDJ1464855.1 YjgN family protein [Nitratireductor sp. GZWM139]